MPTQPQQTGMMLLDRNTIDFYGDKKAPIRLAFPKDVVRDMEVINRDQMVAYIISFLEINKVEPTKMVVVLLEPGYFEKDFPGNEQEQEENIVAFLDSVPFENLLTKTYKIEKGFKIVATNGEMIDSLRHGLQQKGSVLDAVVPIFHFRKDASGNYIFNNLDSAKQESLVIQQPAQPTTSSAHQGNTPKSNKRVMVMLGIFILLILILIGVLIMSSSSAEKSTSLDKNLQKNVQDVNAKK